MTTLKNDRVDELRVTTRGLMYAFKCTRPVIGNLVDAGMPKEATGIFNLNKCWRWRIEHTKHSTSITRANLQDEQAKKAQVERKLKEIELALRKKEIMETADVKKLIERMAGSAQRRILALATKLPPRLAGCSNAGEMQALLEAEIREALEELSRKDYAK